MERAMSEARLNNLNLRNEVAAQQAKFVDQLNRKEDAVISSQEEIAKLRTEVKRWQAMHAEALKMEAEMFQREHDMMTKRYAEEVERSRRAMLDENRSLIADVGKWQTRYDEEVKLEAERAVKVGEEVSHLRGGVQKWRSEHDALAARHYEEVRIAAKNAADAREKTTLLTSNEMVLTKSELATVRAKQESHDLEIEVELWQCKHSKAADTCAAEVKRGKNAAIEGAAMEVALCSEVKFVGQELATEQDVVARMKHETLELSVEMKERQTFHDEKLQQTESVAKIAEEQVSELRRQVENWRHAHDEELMCRQAAETLRTDQGEVMRTQLERGVMAYEDLVLHHYNAILINKSLSNDLQEMRSVAVPIPTSPAHSAVFEREQELHEERRKHLQTSLALQIFEQRCEFLEAQQKRMEEERKEVYQRARDAERQKSQLNSEFKLSEDARAAANQHAKELRERAAMSVEEIGGVRASSMYELAKLRGMLKEMQRMKLL